MLDELNLASAELLDALAPLLNSDLRKFCIPGAPYPAIDLEGVKVFGTMNPITTGGQRKRLPRAIRALFTTVTLTG